MHTQLIGKRALLGGASKGIGAAVARELAAAGAQVTVYARSIEPLQSLCASLPGRGHEAFAVDVADRERLAQELDQRVQKAPYEILVCNLGGPKGGAISQATESEFLTTFQDHLLVNALLARKVLPGMKEKSYGRIINIISTSVKMPIPNLGVSNTIRAAVASWAKTLSFEVAPFGITVNNVLPGFTKTDRLSQLLVKEAQARNITVEQVSEEWRQTVPARRFAEPQEIASAVAFLASPLAGYINGINLPVDGGRTGCL